MTGESDVPRAVTVQADPVHPDRWWWVRAGALVVGGIGLWAVAAWKGETDEAGVVKDATPAITAALASAAWVFMLGAETVHWFFRFLGADPDTRRLRVWSWATVGLVVGLGVWLVVRAGPAGMESGR